MADLRINESAAVGPIEMVLDLVVVVVLTLGTMVAVVSPTAVPQSVRVVLGLGFVFLAPGYAFVSALFPERPNRQRLSATVSDREWESKLGHGERLLIGVATNIFIVPFAGLLLNYTAVGITPSAVVSLLGGFTLVMTGVAWSRRARRRPDERFGVPLGGWIDEGLTRFRAANSQREFVLNVLLVIAILTATSTVVLAAAAPGQGETFTEFYVGTENETAGTFVANDYPTDYVRGQSRSMAVGVTNNEHRPVNYTVVVELQAVDNRDDATTVTATSTVTTYQTRLAHGEAEWEQIAVTPELRGEDHRLTFLLYEGDPPADPSVENAYRHLHVWIDVDEQTGASVDSPARIDPGVTRPAGDTREPRER